MWSLWRWIWQKASGGNCEWNWKPVDFLGKGGDGSGTNAYNDSASKNRSSSDSESSSSDSDDSDSDDDEEEGEGDNANVSICVFAGEGRIRRTHSAPDQLICCSQCQPNNGMSHYEQLRAKNIARNNARLKSLGLLHCRKQGLPEASKPREKKKKPAPEAPVRQNPVRTGRVQLNDPKASTSGADKETVSTENASVTGEEQAELLEDGASSSKGMNDNKASSKEAVLSVDKEKTVCVVACTSHALVPAYTDTFLLFLFASGRPTLFL